MKSARFPPEKGEVPNIEGEARGWDEEEEGMALGRS